jgi:hypothetical protein
MRLPVALQRHASCCPSAVRFGSITAATCAFGSSISIMRCDINYDGAVRCGSKMCDDVRFRCTTATCVMLSVLRALWQHHSVDVRFGSNCSDVVRFR